MLKIHKIECKEILNDERTPYPVYKLDFSKISDNFAQEVLELITPNNKEYASVIFAKIMTKEVFDRAKKSV